MDYELALSRLSNIVNEISRASANDDKSKLEHLSKELQTIAVSIFQHCVIVIDPVEEKELPPLKDFLGVVSGYNLPHPEKFMAGNYIELGNDVYCIEGQLVKSGTVLISMVNRWVYLKAA